MKTYKIIETIMLSFLTPQDQVDYLVGPSDGITLEADKHTIWALQEGQDKLETIIGAEAIDLWLAQGKIVEI